MRMVPVGVHVNTVGHAHARRGACTPARMRQHAYAHALRTQHQSTVANRATRIVSADDEHALVEVAHQRVHCGLRLTRRQPSGATPGGAKGPQPSGATFSAVLCADAALNVVWRHCYGGKNLG